MGNRSSKGRRPAAKDGNINGKPTSKATTCEALQNGTPNLNGNAVIVTSEKGAGSIVSPESLPPDGDNSSVCNTNYNGNKGSSLGNSDTLDETCVRNERDERGQHILMSGHIKQDAADVHNTMNGHDVDALNHREVDSYSKTNSVEPPTEGEDPPEEESIPPNSSSDLLPSPSKPLKDPIEVDRLRRIYEQRPHHLEIVEKALKQNTIVCLSTGREKTFISASIMKEMQGGISGTIETHGKRTVFLVDSSPSAHHQADMIKKTTCMIVGTCTSDLNFESWTHEMWHQHFDRHDILVATYKVLVHLVTQSYIELKNINLLILDDCHKAMMDHPCAQVFNFYDQCEKKHRPHLLGFTGRIVYEKLEGITNISEDMETFVWTKLKLMETRMQSKCVACVSARTNDDAVKPIEIVLPYSTELTPGSYPNIYEMANSDGAVIQNLLAASEKFNALQMECKNSVGDVIGKLPAQTEHGSQVLQGNSSNESDIEINGLKSKKGYAIAADATKLCAEILCEYGPMCGYEAAKHLLKQLKKNKEILFMDNDSVLEELEPILKLLIHSYEECITNSPYEKPRDVEPAEPFITRKARNFLTEVLLHEKNNFRESDTELRALVFAERRCVAAVLSALINTQARLNKDLYDGIRSRHVLGQSMDPNDQIADCTMISVDQNKVIKDFKSGAFSVLVATSAVEKDLYIRQCNLVVRVNKLNDFTQYSRSKKCGCAVNSRLVIMTPHEEKQETELQLQMMHSVEHILTEMSTSMRTSPTQEEIETIALQQSEAENPQTYFAHEGPDSPSFNMNTAVTLLHRYCSYLPSDPYSITTPHFEYEPGNDPETGSPIFRASVCLPMNFPLEEKFYTSKWLPDKATCKRSLCFDICIVLHKAGQLDENLLPVRHLEEPEGDDDGEEDKPKEGTRKSQDYYWRKFPAVLSPPAATFNIEDSELFVISVVLVEPRDRPSSIALKPLWNGSERKGFGILLPPGVPRDLPPIKLFTRAGCLLITFCFIENDNSDLDKAIVSKFHTSMMDICATKHVLGKHVFDIDDARVSKGLIVPLRSFVLDAVQGGTMDASHKWSDNAIDIEGMYDYVLHGGDIGRNKDGGLVNAIINKTYLNEQQNRRLYYIASISEEKGKDIMEGEVTYKYYYESKYNHILEDDAVLLEAVPCPSRVNFFEDPTSKDAKKQSTYKPERLVPALCRKAFRTHAHLHQQLNVFPYVYYHFESILNAHELRDRITETLEISSGDNASPTTQRNVDLNEPAEKILEEMLKQSLVIDHTIKSPVIMEVLETLTTRQAKFPYDLERLEMLGDSFLKQAVTIYLYYKYPTAHEGILSSKRKRCISNKNLCRIAKIIGIQHIICNSQFGNVNPNNENKNSVTVWLPPGCIREEDNVLEKLEKVLPEQQDDDILHITEGDVQNDVENAVERLVAMVISESIAEVQSEDYDECFRSNNLLAENSVAIGTDAGGNSKIIDMEGSEDRYTQNENITENVGAQNGEENENTGNIECENTESISSENPENIISYDSEIFVDHENAENIYNNTDCKTNNTTTGDDKSSQGPLSPRKHEIDIHISKDLPFQLVQDKTLADSVEALIGLYFKIGGTNLALKLMQIFLGIDVLYDAIEEKSACPVQEGTLSYYADFPKQRSAIQNSYSTYEDVMVFYERMKLSRLEEILGYEFQDKSFIVQAMTHLSYTTNDVTGCYQQIEFLGDAILDFLITLHIYVHKPDLSPGDLTSLRSALVNNNTFGLLVVKFKFDRFLKHHSPKLQAAILEFLSVANSTPEVLNACFQNPFVIVPENSEEGYHAPKVLGDVFESIIGAVFMDSHLNLVKTWEVIYPLMKPIIDQYMEEIPLNPIREFYEKHVDGELAYEVIDDSTVVCEAKFNGTKSRTGMGKTKRIAKSTACYKALYG